MKFGKSIRAEARNNRGLSFLNFKYLKRILKRCSAAAKTGAWDVVRDEDRQFHSVLETELKKVGESFWKELQQISLLQNLIQQKLPFLDIQSDPEKYTRMSFEELQLHLQSLGGLDEVPMECAGNNQLSSSVKTSAALCEFCVNLGKISARCKRLRRCVLWNAVAIVKILKKRQKNTTDDMLAILDTKPELAARVLSRQEWYRCPELARIVSIVETTTNELMQRLTEKPPSREQYQCPICLDTVLDPVCLRTCGHRFCWACLCMAYCEKPDGTLERCPCCRAAFPLDPEAFEIDGILSRFLRTFFPEVQSARLKEQRECLRDRLDQLQTQLHLRNQQTQSTEPDGISIDYSMTDEMSLDASQFNNISITSSCPQITLPNYHLTTDTLSSTKVLHSEGDTEYIPYHQNDYIHCCPDCILHVPTTNNSFLLKPKIDQVILPLKSHDYSDDVPLLKSHNKLSHSLHDIVSESAPMMRVNEPLMRTAEQYLLSTTDTDIKEDYPLKNKICRHELNVKQGKPSDVDRFAFTSCSSQSSMIPFTNDDKTLSTLYINDTHMNIFSNISSSQYDNVASDKDSYNVDTNKMYETVDPSSIVLPITKIVTNNSLMSPSSIHKEISSMTHMINQSTPSVMSDVFQPFNNQRYLNDHILLEHPIDYFVDQTIEKLLTDTPFIPKTTLKNSIIDDPSYALLLHQTSFHSVIRPSCFIQQQYPQAYHGQTMMSTPSLPSSSLLNIQSNLMESVKETFIHQHMTCHTLLPTTDDTYHPTNNVVQDDVPYQTDQSTLHLKPSISFLSNDEQLPVIQTNFVHSIHPVIIPTIEPSGPIRVSKHSTPPIEDHHVKQSIFHSHTDKLFNIIHHKYHPTSSSSLLNSLPSLYVNQTPFHTQDTTLCTNQQEEEHYCIPDSLYYQPFPSASFQTYANEAIDDEDDQIEEEFLCFQQKQSTVHQHYAISTPTVPSIQQTQSAYPTYSVYQTCQIH